LVATHNWCSGNLNADKTKATYRRPEGGAVRWTTQKVGLDVLLNVPKTNYSGEEACIQTSPDMIAALALAQGQRG
jgi:hypothetical protein